MGCRRATGPHLAASVPVAGLRDESTEAFDLGGVAAGVAVVADDVGGKVNGCNGRAGVIRFAGGSGKGVVNGGSGCGGVEHAHKAISDTMRIGLNMALHLCQLAPHAVRYGCLCLVLFLRGAERDAVVVALLRYRLGQGFLVCLCDGQPLALQRPEINLMRDRRRPDRDA